jgi:hypothetical protein
VRPERIGSFPAPLSRCGPRSSLHPSERTFTTHPSGVIPGVSAHRSGMIGSGSGSTYRPVPIMFPRCAGTGFPCLLPGDRAKARRRFHIPALPKRRPTHVPRRNDETKDVSLGSQVCKTKQPPQIQTCYHSPDFGDSAFPVVDSKIEIPELTGVSKEGTCDEQLGQSRRP